MTIKLANNTAKAMADTLDDRVNLGSGAGKVKIYAGTAPADADAALSGNTLLGTLTGADPFFGAATDANPGGLITAGAITSDSSADATGTATFFRITDSDDNVVLQGACSAGGGGGDMILNSTAIQANAAIEISSLTLTIPES